MDFYQPLSAYKEEIRLLHILPDEGLADIRRQLLHTQAKAAPVYVALSYTWSDIAFHRDEYIILLDERTFTVGSNLAKALRALRSCNVEYVWVDAICINQTDLEERSK
jgi:hypothetical protein